jgi:hypothetical protein
MRSVPARPSPPPSDEERPEDGEDAGAHVGASTTARREEAADHADTAGAGKEADVEEDEAEEEEEAAPSPWSIPLTLVGDLGDVDEEDDSQPAGSGSAAEDRGTEPARTAGKEPASQRTGYDVWSRPSWATSAAKAQAGPTDSDGAAELADEAGQAGQDADTSRGVEAGAAVGRDISAEDVGKDAEADGVIEAAGASEASTARADADTDAKSGTGEAEADAKAGRAGGDAEAGRAVSDAGGDTVTASIASSRGEDERAAGDSRVVEGNWAVEGSRALEDNRAVEGDADAGRDGPADEDAKRDAAPAVSDSGRGAVSDTPGAGPGEHSGAPSARSSEPALGPAQEATAPEATAAKTSGPILGQPPGPTVQGKAAGARDDHDQAGSAQAPNEEVTIVPGVARYHRSGCILIRFLGGDDIETTSRREAAAKGCKPCRACEPDKPLSA